MIAVAILTALILTPWALLLGIPLIALSIIILFAPLRFNLITQPAYKTLANSMPSISTTEQEALEAGTSWWEKELFMGHPIGHNLKNIPTQPCQQKNKVLSTMKLSSFVAC